MVKKKEKEEIIVEESESMYDDVVMEDSETADLKIKKIKEKLNKCLKENKENLLGWQRSRADFVNAKKENEEKVRESFSYAVGGLIEELLPVIDSFDMAFSNKDTWEKVDKNWRIGVEYIYSQLVSILESNGLKQLNPVGEKFNPNFHTSVEIVDTDKKKEDNSIIDVVQKGYEYNSKVIRAAKVKVAHYNK